MRISAKQYAQSLYESLAGKTAKETNKVLATFVRLLGKNRDLAKTSTILSSFSDIWDRETSTVSAELITARPAKLALDDISKYLQTRTKAKTINLQTKVEEGLIGGFVLRYRDRVLDASLKSNLENLQDKLGK